MSKGDVVLIVFPFTDLSGNKLRPAVILIETEEDITVCFITSQTQRREPSDLILSPNEINRLKKTSLVRTNKIATLDKSLSKGLIGRLTKTELLSLNEKLKQVLIHDRSTNINPWFFPRRWV